MTQPKQSDPDGAQMETKMEHTKGPWEAGPPATGLDPNVKRYVHANGDLVAVVCAGYLPQLRLTEALEANARLIAAAPELLEALKAVYAGTVVSSNRQGIVLNISHLAFKSVEDAIANTEAPHDAEK